MRERYWNFYVATQHKLFYYKHFMLLFRTINWCIAGFLSITALSCVAAWSFWNTHQVLWASLICISQVLQALFPKLPYNDLLISTKFMVSSMDSLLIDIDNDWLRIDIHNYSNKEIQKLLEKHKKRYSKLVNQFFCGEYLPIIKYCEKKAEIDCKNFFAITYHV